MLDFIGDVIGSVLGYDAARSATKKTAQSAQLDRDLQKEFAQNSIAWKVMDAKRAGVHPLAALGSVGSSYSPVSVNYGDGGASYLRDAVSSLGGMGQNLFRARMAGQDAKGRAQEAAAALARSSKPTTDQVIADKLQLERMSLENDLLRSNIARANSAQLGPSLPLENFPPGSVDVVPDRVSVGSVAAPERSPGVMTDYAFARTAGGGYRLVPGADVKTRIEDMPSEWQWWLDNNLMPHADIYADLTRQHPPAPGNVWQYDALRGQFRQVPRSGAGRRAWEFFIRPDLYQQRR